MLRHAVCSASLVIVFVFAMVHSSSPAYAEAANRPSLAGSPIELANAVNALRASFDIAPYSVNPILMSTAQAQADFMASTGSMTHSGPGGIGLTERLLEAGYPLAGELSLGGFRAENITGGDEGMPAEVAVDQWTGDALHLNTMVSQDLTEIGAGVAISNGRVYYVIDAARPISSGVPQASGVVPEVPLVRIPVTVSTPDPKGNVIHEVKPGQTLWQIAITYETKIDEIKRLNNLFDNNIYPGNQLLIRTGPVLPTISPTAIPTQMLTATGLPTFATAAYAEPTALIPGAIPQASGNSRNRVIGGLVGILALALVGGALFTWLGNSEKR